MGTMRKGKKMWAGKFWGETAGAGGHGSFAASDGLKQPPKGHTDSQKAFSDGLMASYSYFSFSAYVIYFIFSVGKGAL